MKHIPVVLITTLFADARFMPQGIEGMYVTPDGTTFTNIRWEEGGGKVAVVTSDGEVQPRPQVPGYHGWGHGGGRAVTANSKYVFFSQNYNNEGGSPKNTNNWPPVGKNWYGISRRFRSNIGGGPAFADGRGGKDSPAGCFLPVHEVPTSTKEDAVHIRSLCASEEELFVSCPYDNQIRVYDAELMTFKRSWEVKDAWQLARDVCPPPRRSDLYHHHGHGLGPIAVLHLPVESRDGWRGDDPRRGLVQLHKIIQEEDGRSKNLLYRWNPTTSPKVP